VQLKALNIGNGNLDVTVTYFYDFRVFQKVADNTSEASESAEQEIWQLSTQSGPRDLWYRAQVTLASSLPFKVRIIL
jgi:hypothetical protein